MGWFGKSTAKTAPRARAEKARAPDGLAIYAVGDVHGRLDLFQTLMGKITADVERLPEGVSPRLVMLGDYVDRGPGSRGVLDALVALKIDGGEAMVALKGNHEEAMLDFLNDPFTGAGWADHGGRETLISYGVTLPRQRNDPNEWVKARDELAAALPPEHLSFLQGLQTWTQMGDYLFVHAGVRPGIAIEDQEERDLLWIRADFLDSPRASPHTVVHGHTPSDGPALGPGRIGVDTGAYATGVLTAVRLEGENRSFISTGAG